MNRLEVGLSTIERRLDQIAMSSSERRDAREDLRKAEALVDVLFAAFSKASAVFTMNRRTKVALVRRARRFLFGYGQRRGAAHENR